jgi:hypothetical protein
MLILAGKVSKLSTTFVQCIEVSFEFSDDRSFRTDFVQKGKTELKRLPL